MLNGFLERPSNLTRYYRVPVFRIKGGMKYGGYIKTRKRISKKSLL